MQMLHLKEEMSHTCLDVCVCAYFFSSFVFLVLQHLPLPASPSTSSAHISSPPSLSLSSSLILPSHCCCGGNEKSWGSVLLCSALLFIMANGTKLLSSCHTHTYKSPTQIYRGRGLKLGCQAVESRHSVIAARSRSFLTSDTHTHRHTHLSAFTFS